MTDDEDFSIEEICRKYYDIRQKGFITMKNISNITEEDIPGTVIKEFENKEMLLKYRNFEYHIIHKSFIVMKNNELDPIKYKEKEQVFNDYIDYVKKCENFLSLPAKDREYYDKMIKETIVNGLISMCSFNRGSHGNITIKEIFEKEDGNKEAKQLNHTTVDSMISMSINLTVLTVIKERLIENGFICSLQVKKSIPYYKFLNEKLDIIFEIKLLDLWCDGDKEMYINIYNELIEKGVIKENKLIIEE